MILLEIKKEIINTYLSLQKSFLWENRKQIRM